MREWYGRVLASCGFLACSSAGGGDAAPNGSGAPSQANGNAGTPGAESAGDGGAGSADGGGHGLPTSGDVKGTLKNASGKPVAGMDVRVVDGAGAGQQVKTDAEGAFAFDGLSFPYDLHFEGGSGFDHLIGLDYLGLHTTSVAAVLPGGPLEPNVALTLSGESPVSLPDCATGCHADVFLELPNGENDRIGAISYENPPPPTVSLTQSLRLAGDATTPCTVRVLVSVGSPPPGTPRYWYSETAGTLKADVVTASARLTLAATPVPAPIGATTITATIDTTALQTTDVVLVGESVRVKPGVDLRLRAGRVPQTATTMGVVVPVLPGASSVELTLSTTESGGQTSTGFVGPIGSTTASFVMVAPPQVTAPAAGSTVDGTTVFTWKPQAGVPLYRLLLAAGRTVFTASNSVTLSRLDALSPLPVGALSMKVASFWGATQDIDGFVSSGTDVGTYPSTASSSILTVTRSKSDADAGPDGG